MTQRSPHDGQGRNREQSRLPPGTSPADRTMTKTEHERITLVHSLRFRLVRRSAREGVRKIIFFPQPSPSANGIGATVTFLGESHVPRGRRGNVKGNEGEREVRERRCCPEANK